MKKLDISGPQTRLPVKTETGTGKALTSSRNLIEIAERIETERAQHLWTDAIACARDVALACLPRKRTDEKVVKKSIAFGPDCQVTVKYSVPDDCEMPFGSDRFVFFGIQHLARISNSPLVEFEKAGQLLEMFGLPDGGAEYRRLRARFERLRSLNIEIETVGSGKGAASNTKWGIGSRFIEEWSLPTRQAVDAELAGQGTLQLSGPRSPYYVQLSESLFRRVQKGSSRENVLLLRLDLLKHFRDSPIGWDFCVFLLHRCGSARSHSVVPHDVLMEFFKSGKERDYHTAARLKHYFQQIKTATGNSLNAELVSEDVCVGRGRPRKKWALKVGPSQSVVIGGSFGRKKLS